MNKRKFQQITKDQVEESSIPRPLDYDDYTVGWVAVLPCEVNAARLLIDHEHERLDAAPGDPNNYILGDMGGHNIVLAYPGAGRKGESAATHVATNMIRTFEQIRFGLLVGVAGAAPKPPDREDALRDIRLGDVVVSCPVDDYGGGVRQVDYGKRLGLEEFRLTDHLNKPPVILLTGVETLQSDHAFQKGKMYEYIHRAAEKSKHLKMKGYVFPGWQKDQLFKASYNHPQITGEEEPEPSCSRCDVSQTESRLNRDSDLPAVHYGIIASGNQVVRSAEYRDQLRKKHHVLCFEMEAAGLMDSFPCLVIRGICDYSDDHKNKEWQQYAATTAAAYAKDLLRIVRPQRVWEQRLVAELVASLRDIHSMTSNTNADVRDVLHTIRQEKDMRIINWFSNLPSQKKQQDVLNQHQKGTGEFFLKSQKFTNWLHGKDRILWCIGPPGAGKTVLTSIVIKTINNSLSSPKVGMAFLYCVYADRNKQTIDQLLGSVIQQLLLQRNVIPEDIRELYDSHSSSNTRPGLIELFQQLNSIVSLFSKVYIVVDALDECDDTTTARSSLLVQLEKLDTHVQLFFTSRPLEGILLDAVQFQVTAQEDDMRKYLSAQVKKESRLTTLCANNRGLQDEIINKIVMKAGGMFLLAALHFQSIANQLRLGTVRKALQTLPVELEDTYDEAMERIRTGQKKNQSELAMKLLMLLSYVLRPLKLGEIQHALLTMEVEAGETTINRDDVYDKELLLTICAGIVISEDGTSTFRFVHHSAETYFESKRERFFKNGHSELTKTCVTYLCFDYFKNGVCNTDIEFKERLHLNKFYHYATHNWGHHAREASTFYPSIMEFLEDSLKIEASTQALMSRKYPHGWSLEFSMGVTGLHLVAYFGIQEAVSVLLQRSRNIDLQDIYGRTPLLYATKNGHEVIVKLLLSAKKVNINAKYRHSRTLLSFAAMGGHEATVKLLLTTEKVNIDALDCYSRTPLSYATQNGHEATVKLLLATKKVDVNIKNKNSGQAPLSYAAKNGHEAIVKLLLATEKVNIDALDRYSRTPFSYATQNGHEAIVKLLLATKQVDVNVKDMNFEAPLSYAAKNGYEAIVKLLLATEKVNIDAKDRNSQTALCYATRNGHGAIVKLLLATKQVDVNVKNDISGQAPLSYAVESRHEAIVKLLLATEKVDINTKDHCSRTPLSYATIIGHEAIVKLLLATKKVDVDAKDYYRHTPLSYAAIWGHEAIAKLLLTTEKVDINTMDHYGRTPLFRAAENGHQAIIKLLLATEKVDINTKDSCSRTPLSRAAENGHEAIVKLLKA